LPFANAKISAKKPRNPAYPAQLKTVGDHIRSRRLDLGLLQREVASRLGVSASAVLNWEKGICAPTFRALPAIIAWLGYDPRPEPSCLSEALVHFREGRGMSQAEAAGVLEVDPSTLARWERGERTPKSLLQSGYQGCD
jgi:transcriptional regulator with XRE-family HTH domain